MKTFVTTTATIERDWWVVDAQGLRLGRLATEVASLLKGKHKPYFAPYLDCGDHVVVINAGEILLSGSKAEKKVYYHHSGYPGGLRESKFLELMERHPERAVELAIKGMLPKNRLGRQMFRKLKVYAGPTHPHAAQQPVMLDLNNRLKAL